jgi:hypothetical protein
MKLFVVNLQLQFAVVLAFPVIAPQHPRVWVVRTARRQLLALTLPRDFG